MGGLGLSKFSTSLVSWIPFPLRVGLAIPDFFPGVTDALVGPDVFGGVIADFSGGDALGGVLGFILVFFGVLKAAFAFGTLDVVIFFPPGVVLLGGVVAVLVFGVNLVG